MGAPKATPTPTPVPVPVSCGTPTSSILISGAGDAGANQTYHEVVPGGLWQGDTNLNYTLNVLGGGAEWGLRLHAGPLFTLYRATLEAFPCVWTIYNGVGTAPAPVGAYV